MQRARDSQVKSYMVAWRTASWRRNLRNVHRALFNCRRRPSGAIQKTYLFILTKNVEEFSGKSSERMDQWTEKDKTERETGLGRRTREETAKWNPMTALRFQIWGRHQTSPASIQGLTQITWKMWVKNGIIQLFVLLCPNISGRDEATSICSWLQCKEWLAWPCYQHPNTSLMSLWPSHWGCTHLYGFSISVSRAFAWWD